MRLAHVKKVVTPEELVARLDIGCMIDEVREEGCAAPIATRYDDESHLPVAFAAMPVEGCAPPASGGVTAAGCAP